MEYFNMAKVLNQVDSLAILSWPFRLAMIWSQC